MAASTMLPKSWPYSDGSLVCVRPWPWRVVLVTLGRVGVLGLNGLEVGGRRLMSAIPPKVDIGSAK